MGWILTIWHLQANAKCSKKMWIGQCVKNIHQDDFCGTFCINRCLETSQMSINKRLFRQVVIYILDYYVRAQRNMRSICKCYTDYQGNLGSMVKWGKKAWSHFFLSYHWCICSTYSIGIVWWSQRRKTHNHQSVDSGQWLLLGLGCGRRSEIYLIYSF